MKSHADSPVDLTTALQHVEASLRKLLGAGLTRKAVLVLLAHETKHPMKTIDQVLSAAVTLSKWTEKPR